MGRYGNDRSASVSRGMAYHDGCKVGRLLAVAGKSLAGQAWMLAAPSCRARLSCSQSTNKAALRFRALLTNGVERLEWVGL